MRQMMSLESMQGDRCRFGHGYLLVSALVALFMASAVRAEGMADLFSSGVLFDETSDAFQRTEIFFDYRNHRREMFWPWEDADTRDLDWGIGVRHLQGSVDAADFQGAQVQAMLGKRFSRALYAEAWLGAHQLKVSQSDENTITTYATSVHLTPVDWFRLQIESSENFVYPESVLPGGISEQLTARTDSASLQWRPVRRVRAIAKGLWRELDDGNVEDRVTLAILYGLSPEWPWIWAGIGGEKLQFDQPRSSYWSPQEYLAYGLRFESSFPITDWLTGNIAVNLDRLREDEARADGQYYALGLEIRLAAATYLRINATRINSLQESVRWFENTYIVSLAGALF